MQRMRLSQASHGWHAAASTVPAESQMCDEWYNHICHCKQVTGKACVWAGLQAATHRNHNTLPWCTQLGASWLAGRRTLLTAQQPAGGSGRLPRCDSMQMASLSYGPTSLWRATAACNQQMQQRLPARTRLLRQHQATPCPTEAVKLKTLPARSAPSAPAPRRAASSPGWPAPAAPAPPPPGAPPAWQGPRGRGRAGQSSQILFTRSASGALMLWAQHGAARLACTPAEVVQAPGCPGAAAKPIQQKADGAGNAASLPAPRHAARAALRASPLPHARVRPPVSQESKPRQPRCEPAAGQRAGSAPINQCTPQSSAPAASSPRSRAPAPSSQRCQRR